MAMWYAQIIIPKQPQSTGHMARHKTYKLMQKQQADQVKNKIHVYTAIIYGSQEEHSVPKYVYTSI